MHVEYARFDTGAGKIELPVNLKVHVSIFVPLATWTMLLADNYRCVQKNGMRRVKQRSIPTSMHRGPWTTGWLSCSCPWVRIKLTWEV